MSDDATDRVKALLEAVTPVWSVAATVSGKRGRRQFLAVLSCRDRQAAYAAYQRFQPLPLTLVQRTRIKPAELVTYQEEAGILNDDLHPVYWQHRADGRHFLVWWTALRLGDNESSRVLVRCEAHIQIDPAWLAERHHKGGPRGDTIVSYEWVPRGYPVGEITSEPAAVRDKPGARTVWFPSHGPSVARALRVEKTAAAKA